MLSSLKLNTKTPIGKQQSKKIKNILQSLINSNDSIQFRAPVDWKGLNLIDYPIIIKYPMDLGTVTYKFNQNKYQFVEEVLDDVQIIWDNCKVYNPETSWIHNLAEKLERSYKKMIKNYLPYISVVIPGRNAPLSKDDRKISQTSNPNNNSYQTNPINPNNNPNTTNNPSPNNQYPQKQPQQIPFNQKIKLSDRLKTLSPLDIGYIVQYIMEKCPSAFKETGDQNAELLVDNLDLGTFREVNFKIDEILGELQDRVMKKVKFQ